MLTLHHTKEEINEVISFVQNRIDMTPEEKKRALDILDCILKDKLDKIISMFKAPIE